MKNVFSRIIAAILVMALAACSPQSDSTMEDGSVRVLAPMSTSSGKYSLDIFELKGITDLQTVTGKFARFFWSPRISNNKLEGITPKGRFIKNNDGDYVPANEMTQQMVTIYAHMQRLAALDEELGAGGVNSWPRDVGVSVRVRGGSTNNAFYDGVTDSMLLVPYSQDNLPIPINGGILAHEHFHSLFYKMVMADDSVQVHSRHDFLPEKQGEELNLRTRILLPISSGDDMSAMDMHRYYHLAMLRGLNEGLADYWGWMYTGDPDFIAQSLPSEKSVRSLQVNDDRAAKSLPSVEAIQRSLRIFYSGVQNKNRFPEYVTGYAYSLGTQFSRVLKRFSDVYSQTRGVDDLKARKEIGKLVVLALPKLKEDINALGEEFYSSATFFKSVAANLADLHEQECAFVSEVVNSSTSDEKQKIVCAQTEEGVWSLQIAPALEKSEGSPK